MLQSLRRLGYTNLLGVEINDQAAAHCLANGLNVARSITDVIGLKAGLVIMSHVLEHLQKKAMVNILSVLRSSLESDGSLFICVPNAQSATGAYWAYEDFTHEYLFTSGSLFYVARLAGFSQVVFVDIDCTEGLDPLKATVRRLLLSLYRLRYKFWNKVTGSHAHYASRDIFSYEIKAICR
jgi:hypothetical protein